MTVAKIFLCETWLEAWPLLDRRLLPTQSWNRESYLNEHIPWYRRGRNWMTLTEVPNIQLQTKNPRQTSEREKFRNWKKGSVRIHILIHFKYVNNILAFKSWRTWKINIFSNLYFLTHNPIKILQPGHTFQIKIKIGPYFHN